MAHAFLSPSGAPAWTRCNIKPWREKDLPDTSSGDADEGTAAHFLLEQCLLQNVDAAHFHGNAISVNPTEFRLGAAYPVGPDMTREVQKALDVIRSTADGATIYAEQELPIDFITGETGATGTSDTVIMRGSIAEVMDLKYGRGVQVYADGNEQLLIYGASVIQDFDLLGEVEELRLHILQPRLNHFDTWSLPVAEVHERIAGIRQIAERITAGPDGLTAVPGDKQCKFCKAKATCPEYRDFVLGAVAEEFVDLDKGFVEVSIDQAEKLLANAFGVKPAAVDFDTDGAAANGRFVVKKPSIRPTLEAAVEKLPDAEDERLATLMDAADMIDGFAKAVRAEVERRLLAGKFTDARYKLVEGRQGARAWIDEAEAEKTLKSMRLKVDEMYDFKVISPTSAEKLLQASNPRKWAKLQPMIGRSDGKPSVAPASDKRPALSLAIAEQFEELPEDDNEDLV